MHSRRGRYFPFCLPVRAEHSSRLRTKAPLCFQLSKTEIKYPIWRGAAMKRRVMRVSYRGLWVARPHRWAGQHENCCRLKAEISDSSAPWEYRRPIYDLFRVIGRCNESQIFDIQYDSLSALPFCRGGHSGFAAALSAKDLECLRRQRLSRLIRHQIVPATYPRTAETIAKMSSPRAVGPETSSSVDPILCATSPIPAEVLGSKKKPTR